MSPFRIIREGITMEKMFQMMEEMMEKMGGEERVNMMTRCMEICLGKMSDEEKGDFAKRAFFSEKGDGESSDQMQKMMISMMNMVSMSLMKDIMSGGGGGQGHGHGPKMGKGKGMMMGRNPMKMMQRMMGQAFNEKNEKEEQKKEKEKADDTAQGHPGSG